MIDQEKITLDWIEKVSKANRNADRILVEKVIRALLLLEGLVKQKLSFVFKGGTALMLHLNSAKRLSIDIDIIVPKRPENFEKLLDKVVNEQGFLRKELQLRSADSMIDKAHYKFFYSPIHKTRKDDEYVLLDVLFEDVHYKSIVQLNIQSSFVPETGSLLAVNAPCLEDITGDKLTAFAPNTTGIPYYKRGDNMSMEIIKQLYDIGNLADVVSNIEIIKSTFHEFAKTELSYRGQDSLSAKDVLEDIYQTALCIVTRGIDGNGDFNSLQQGIQRVSRFIFSESYHIEKAIVHASKAAYLSVLIANEVTKIYRFDPQDVEHLREAVIREPLPTKLNKLKKTNLEAFFYWNEIMKYKTAISENKDED